MSSVPSTPAGDNRHRLSFTQWLIVVMAAIGFAFDTYQLLMMQFIAQAALSELGNVRPGTDAYARWFGALFYIPAFAGGIFGLLGGYLTDRLGRRRVLTWSILLYAFSAFGTAYATTLWAFLVLRCLTFVGVCVEFVAAIAWLAELFHEPHQREAAIGYTQAFSSFGGLMVAAASGAAAHYATRLPAITLPASWALWLGTVIDVHAPWRYTLMSGLIPAIPLILIRPFLPESPVWRERKLAGTLRRPSLRELFAPELLRTTIVTTVMFACSYGAAFGAIQQMPQIVRGLPEVMEQTKGQSPREQRRIAMEAAARYGTVQEVGGLAGRFLLAFLAVRILTRRGLLRIFQLPGLIIVPLVFAFPAVRNQPLFTIRNIAIAGIETGDIHVTLLHVGIFFAGLFTVGQFSFWGNYLPRVYPVHLRGTGESFAANIGGRMIGTSFAWVTSTLAVQSFMPGSTPSMKIAYAAAGVAFFVYFVGSVACFFLPEPKAEVLLD